MPRHEAIVDWEILNPGRTQRECAKELGMTEVHISVIRHSDAFIAYRHNRLAAHHGNVSDTVVGKTEGLAKLSLDILSERFEAERAKVPLGGVKDTCEMALKALGFGGASNAPKSAGNVVNLILGASSEQLASAREKIKAVNSAPVIDQTPEQKEEPISGTEVLQTS